MQNVVSIIGISFIVICSKLPFSLLQATGRFIGRLCYFLNTKGAQTIRTNLFYCFPEKTKNERRQLEKKALENTCSCIFEAGAAWVWPPEKSLELITEVEGLDLLTNAIAEPKGVVVLAPHVGNWELLNHFLNHHSQLTAMYRPQKWDLFDKWMRKVRSGQGSQMVPTNRSGVMSLMKALKQHKLVGILPDQVPDPQSGDYAPFFGISALTVKLPVQLIQKTNSTALLGFVKRLPDGKGFKAVFRKADSEVYNLDMKKALAGLNRTVENSALDSLEQYQWTYKRFKRSPFRGNRGIYS